MVVGVIKYANLTSNIQVHELQALTWPIFDFLRNLETPNLLSFTLLRFADVNCKHVSS